MCGIAGIVRFDDRPISPDRLAAMLAHLKHRGPDGEGISDHGRCALVHARLAIIDLLSGKQPMHLAPQKPVVGDRIDADVPQRGSTGALHLVFNGEIYNHQELRRKLEKRGHVFASHHSDTEVLLYGYRQWGENVAKHLHGMFAFAIWDQQHRRLFLARDRTGLKPLFIRVAPDRRGVAFASLVGTLVAGLEPGERAEVNRAALLNYLRLGYTFGQSMVDGVSELPAAHFMRIEADGQTQVRRYWRPPPISKHSTALGAVDALDEVLTEAVVKRLEADVPLGCFLSGGIDSSVISAMAQRRLTRRDGGGRLRTYSVAMPDALYDETPHARRVADHIGADHTVLRCEVGDAMADLQRMMHVAGEPTADSSLLPSHWVCKAARPHCKAALSGDGGDELFGGYDRYRAMRLLAKHHAWIKLLPASFFRRGHAKSRQARFGRLLAAAKAGPSPDHWYRSMIHLFTDRDIAALIPGLIENDNPTGSALSDWPDEADLAHAAMRWDLQHYLPFELLRKVDRASMTVALEVRCPLLDTQVCDLAGHLPTAVIMPGGRPKGLLRQVAARYLPADIVRRPKRGFAVPIDDWLRNRLRDGLHDHLFDGRLESLGIDPAVTRRYFDQHTQQRADHTHRLFALLQLSLWLGWLHTDPTPPPRVGLD